MSTHSIAGGRHGAGHQFSYFTILTYWGLAFYNFTSAIHTYGFARNGSPLLDRFPRPLQALHSLFYSTITTYPFIVTIVFWGILYPGHVCSSLSYRPSNTNAKNVWLWADLGRSSRSFCSRLSTINQIYSFSIQITCTNGAQWFALEFDAWSNLSEHAMNSGFALFEIIFTRTEAPPFIHAFWLIIVLAFYLALAYITHATEGWYVYPFLNPSNGPILAGYIVGIAVAAVVIFSIVNCIIRGRKWLTERKLHKTGKFGVAGRDFEPAIELENGLTASGSLDK